MKSNTHPTAAAQITTLLLHIDQPQQLAYPEELAELARSAGFVVVGEHRLLLRQPHAATLIGSGAIETLKTLIAGSGARQLIVGTGLSPIAERNLSRILEVAVMDRTRLILDIFAARARSREGRLQVQLACLEYDASRLVRSWTHLERQRGGIGLRGGPGETQIELDRRQVKEKMRLVRQQLVKLERQRHTQAEGRRHSKLPLVALVGYTNAGKSTLFNQLTRAHAYAADQLFATLDPLVRRGFVPGVGTVLFADTVGLVHELPHQLVAAFHSTLEEVRQADVLLHVTDSASGDIERQRQAVEEVLHQIEAQHIPRLLVLNKTDLSGIAPEVSPQLNWVRLSAHTGEGLSGLHQLLELVIKNRPAASF